MFSVRSFRALSLKQFRAPFAQRINPCIVRKLASGKKGDKSAKFTESNTTVAYYLAGVATLLFGLSYASVPLYKVFCQMTGYGGTTQKADERKSALVKPVPGGKVIRVSFSSNVHDALGWKFTPTQKEVRVVPGETALAFYTVKNMTDKAITGVATYNVHPPKAGLYFSKIQCFCFEEQRLAPKEEIDMPVFFYIDPEFTKDPSMDNVNNIVLSYTFFKTGEEEPETEAAAAAVVAKSKEAEAEKSQNTSKKGNATETAVEKKKEVAATPATAKS